MSFALNRLFRLRMFLAYTISSERSPSWPRESAVKAMRRAFLLASVAVHVSMSGTVLPENLMVTNVYV